jgi:hypothetical protein
MNTRAPLPHTSSSSLLTTSTSIQGWSQLDDLRKKLEDLKELRDLVRSLGRGGGWGPLR